MFDLQSDPIFTGKGGARLTKFVSNVEDTVIGCYLKSFEENSVYAINSRLPQNTLCDEIERVACPEV